MRGSGVGGLARGGIEPEVLFRPTFPLLGTNNYQVVAFRDASPAAFRCYLEHGVSTRISVLRGGNSTKWRGIVRVSWASVVE